MSGNGNEIYNIYDLKTKTWRRLLDKPLTDGEGKRNAYLYGPIIRSRWLFSFSLGMARIALTVLPNHDHSYARSKDLLSWETSTGKPLTLPITLENLRDR